MGGIIILFRRNLGYEHHLDLRVEGAIEENPLHQIPILKMTNGEAQLLFFVGGWFLYTLTRSIQYARRKDFANHQQWMVRHVAGGIWVAPQRLLVGIISSSYGFLMGEVPVSGHVQGMMFSQVSFVALAGCILMGEYAVGLLKLNG